VHPSLLCSRTKEHFLPVLIEPVVDLGLGVNGVAKVGGSGGSNPELLLISAEHVVNQLLILSLVIFLNDAEVSECGAYKILGALSESASIPFLMGKISQSKCTYWSERRS
jgi:hypothetical protein